MIVTEFHPFSVSTESEPSPNSSAPSQLMQLIANNPALHLI